ncbi:hypothetical protein [Daejeonella sp.]|jgi:hypothetical protein|uniref:hypothetical protein n=1 Tax=Daejeonella sp. TaxID=2805397 RepID=UPI0037835D01
MNDIDLTKIKYYPDRFYICLDGFDTDNLTTFITDLDIGQHQAVFIHEYYHFLTNMITFPDLDPNCDNFETFVPPPIKGIVFQLALNELNLFGVYLREL